MTSRLTTYIVFTIIAIFIIFTAPYTIESGNYGVTKTLGKVNVEEIPSGFHLKLPFLTSVEEFSGKEINIDLTNLTPKASDNLSLRDMDVTVFYKVDPNKIAELKIKYANSHRYDRQSGSYFPAYQLVYRESRRASYETIATVPSLELHKKRVEAAALIKKRLQSLLDENDKKTFFITRVIIRSVITDPSIERSIRIAVASKKRLEAKNVQVQIAKKEAEIEIERAKGVAEANKIINKSLTPEYLQHELNKALFEFARSGKANTIVVPASMKGLGLIVPKK